MIHFTNFPRSTKTRSKMEGTKGLITTANSQMQNPKNGQEGPCYLKALKTHTLHSENESNLLLHIAVVSIEHKELF